MPVDLALLARTLLAVAILVAIATAVLGVYGVPHRWASALAVLRGTAQLAAISFVLSGVITDTRWVAVALLVMFAVAAGTSTSRLGWSGRHLGVVSAAMALGIGLSLSVIFGLGAVEAEPRYLLALGGMVIGSTMSVATLTGRRVSASITDHWLEVEGWLALGATPRQATADLARVAVRGALIPAIDQTRTTGLVTLPGAFVGAIFGGLSPLEAGRFQIVVLAAIMAAGAITAVTMASVLAPAARRPADVPG